MPIWLLILVVAALYRWCPTKGQRMAGLALLATTASFIGS